MGGQPSAWLFGKDARTKIKEGGGDDQSHTLGESCWLRFVGWFVLLFCAGLRLLRFSLAGNVATGALTALQLCFSEAVASVSSGTTIER